MINIHPKSTKSHSKPVSRGCKSRGNLSFALAGLLGLSVSESLAQTNNYYGTDGPLNAMVWSTDPFGPYTSALDTTGGAIINFFNQTTTVTGASITVAGINAAVNVTTWTPGGTIVNFNNGIVPIDVTDGVTLDFNTQSFTSSTTAGYIKNGNGTVALAGNTYGGGFALNAGTVIARGVNAFGSGGTLRINGGIIAANNTRDFSNKFAGGIVIGGNFQLGDSVGLASPTANLTFNNEVDLGADTRTITMGGTGNYTFNGAISGAGGITVASFSGGSLVLSGANTYGGPTNIQGGTVVFSKRTALPNAQPWTDSTLSVQSGASAVFGVGGADGFTAADIDVLSTLGSAAGGFQAGSKIGFDTTGGAFTYGAPITDPSGFERGLLKAGANTLTLTASNTYTGPTVINSGGILEVGNGGATGDLGFTSSVTANGTLRINRSNDVTIAQTITGTGAFQHVGSGTTTITGANAYTGTTLVSGGTLTYAGDASLVKGAALTVSGPLSAVVNFESAGTLAFDGTPLVGSTGESGAVNHKSGTVDLVNGSSYLTVGNGGYGSYVMSGGTLNITGAAGARIGATNATGQGVFTQTGGIVNLTRYFAIGQGGGIGVATLSGGSFNSSTTYGILVGDNGTGNGTLNIGTQAGGNALVVSQAAVTGPGLVVGNGAPGTLNLNSGTVQIVASSIRRGSNTGILNLNGAVVQAGAPDVTLINDSLTGTIYRGGAIFDTQTFNATVSASFSSGSGDGIYVPGGKVPVNSGVGYIGAPLVTVSGGTGFGASAIAEVTDGVITGVALTNPGQNYLPGDSITFEFRGGGAAVAANTFNYVLTAEDLAANNEGGLVKLGSGTLHLNGFNTYAGDTVVTAGNLAVNGAITGSTVFVEESAKLSGIGSMSKFGSAEGAVVVEDGGTIAPGNAGAGTLTVTGGILLSAGSIIEFDLLGTDFTQGSSLNDMIATDTLTLDGVLVVNELIASSFLGASQGDRWRLFNFGSAGLIDNGLEIGAMPALSGGMSFAIDTSSGTGVDLVVVPEPGSAVSLLLGLGLVAARRRRVNA